MAWCPECNKFFDIESGVCPECGELLENRKSAKHAENASCGCADCSECGGDCASCGGDCGSFASLLSADDYDEECTGDCDPGIWPLGDDGEAVKPALLMTVSGTQIDYEMALARLRSYGIPSVRDFPAAGEVAKIIFGFSGTGMDIYVPENMVEIARELMRPVEDEE
ncbi:MAG: hypothetical protein PUB32_08180 [Clostridiales bacterium]|nr:hypothetical protein [Clostridiales bacterium]